MAFIEATITQSILWTFSLLDFIKIGRKMYKIREISFTPRFSLIFLTTQENCTGIAYTEFFPNHEKLVENGQIFIYAEFTHQQMHIFILKTH